MRVWKDSIDPYRRGKAMKMQKLSQANGGFCCRGKYRGNTFAPEAPYMAPASVVSTSGMTQPQELIRGWYGARRLGQYKPSLLD